MTRRSWLLLVCVVAALHGIFFILYQRPDWFTQWSDQDGYRRLGEVLARTGKFTRYPDAPQFVPEVLRTPVYPMFVAAVYRIAGVSHLAVAVAQTGVFVLVCLLVFATARMFASERLAVGAAALTAVFPPLPYFGALVMTELWTAFVFTATVWASVRAVHRRTAGAWALTGALAGASALSRPVFALYAVALAGVTLVLFPLFRVRIRGVVAGTLLMLVACGMTMAPWFAYNYVYLGRLTISPAGGVGRGLWEGSWQAKWSGRIQNELTLTADETQDRRELDARVEAIARREHADPGPMLEYVHQWQDIRRIWTEPLDPVERARARVKADEEYRRVGLENLRDDPPGHLVKRLARGVFILWAGEIPIRYSDINRVPPVLIHLCWALQAILFAAALCGIVVLARHGRRAEACVLAAPILYITAVHFPLLTEARQSLPAQPTVLLLAAVGLAYMSGHLLAGEPQVHEREHL